VSNRIRFTLKQNDHIQQRGNTALMLWDIPSLITHLSGVFTLSAGDLIFTGTPEGVSKLYLGDRLRLEIIGGMSAEFSVLATFHVHGQDRKYTYH
jgi:2-keto-4-pentenoate hydratase/2-oxohepta-3-ene-1,7-dioic acid hydratase in catechol pathway